MSRSDSGESDLPQNAHHVGSEAELESGESILAEVDGIEIAVYHTEDGYFAISNFCVHQGGPLCEGPVTGTLSQDDDGKLCYDEGTQVVRCPWHGWEFDVETGEHLSRPEYSQPTYDVLVRDGEVYVRW
ncbi:Rieske (2Fe-2S) protein [Halorientalis pallida]|uniref:Rieske (2Fe-2S) protein n=1 Tax=Halorientalis pallida TaxID=2479928 RepID=A0A498KW87_9EURY|nr:Rieske (2Fe-2S) protein [Halorientalis pallida]RXK47979.1 Rieske (2Fe-2S) protein [Halorientalis pallida]